MLITIEGIDGTGKTTVVSMLGEKFPYSILTHEPQNKNFVASNSTNPVSSLYAYLLDHAMHVENVIRKNINDNLIICDRYTDSRIAYQAADLHTSLERISDMHFVSYSPQPDMTFILVGKIDTIMDRLEKRDGKFFYLTDKTLPEKYHESLKKDYIRRLEDIQNNYMLMAKLWSNRCVLIDVTDLTSEEVANAIEYKLSTFFERRINLIQQKQCNGKAMVCRTPS